jgi:hypothetical protein
MQPRKVVVATSTAVLAGAGFVAAHVLWYRLLDQSPTVDILGSLVLGGVAAVAALLVQLTDDVDWMRVAVASAVGFLAHILVTPAFTPFGLVSTDVNRVLFVIGAGVALGSQHRSDS